MLVAINVLNFYDRHVAGALVEPVRKEFGLTDTQIGGLDSFTWLYAIVGLPMGLLADRVSRKSLLAAGIAVWGCSRFGCAGPPLIPCCWFRGWDLPWVKRRALPWPQAGSAIFFRPKAITPLALFMLGVPVGGALSFFFSGPIAQAFGWRAAMIAAAVPALLLVPVVLMLREPERGAAEAYAPAEKASIFDVFKIPTFYWIILSGALVNFNLYALGTFLPAFMGRVHHLK